MIANKSAKNRKDWKPPIVQAPLAQLIGYHPTAFMEKALGPNLRPYYNFSQKINVFKDLKQFFTNFTQNILDFFLISCILLSSIPAGPLGTLSISSLSAGFFMGKNLALR